MSLHRCLEIFVNFSIITENVSDALISGTNVSRSRRKIFSFYNYLECFKIRTIRRYSYLLPLFPTR
jgi:hypothetical protein